jgi:hypothetical protein
MSWRPPSGFSISGASGFALRITEPVCPAPPFSCTRTTIRGRGIDERTYTVRVMLDVRGIATSRAVHAAPSAQRVKGTVGSS